MTRAPDATLSLAERDGLETLQRILLLSERFRLVIIVCDPPSRCRELGGLAALRAGRPVHEVDLMGPPADLLDAIRDASPPGSAVRFVYGLERWLRADPAGDVLAHLSVRRDAFGPSLPGILVLWTPRPVYAVMAQRAANFVAAAMVVRIPPPGPSIDPGKVSAEILNLAEHYKGRRQAEKAAGLPELIDGLQDLERFQRFVDRAREPFLCMLLGQTKAGKSELLNALLGHSVLPTDVLQATSVPIELAYGAQTKLQVQRWGQPQASGAFQDEFADDIPARLRDIAQLSELHRALPVAQLNELLVANKGQVGDDVLRRELPRLYQDNPYRLGMPEFEARVRGYLSRTDWEMIPSRVRVVDPAVPAGLDFMDTPGVYASGGLGMLTLYWLQRAGAILMVVNPTDLAADTSRRILESIVPERRREALFLVLTRAGHYQQGEVQRHLNEARRLYPELPPEHILAVDSVLGLAEAEMDRGRALSDLLQEGRFLTALAPLWVQANYDARRVHELLRERSRLSELRQALAPLRGRAPVMPALDVLERLQSAYRTRLELLQPAQDAVATRDKLAQARRALDLLRKRYDLRSLAEALRPVHAQHRQRLAELGFFDGERFGSVMMEYAEALRSRIDALSGEFSRSVQQLLDPPLPPLTLGTPKPADPRSVPWSLPPGLGLGFVGAGGLGLLLVALDLIITGGLVSLVGVLATLGAAGSSRWEARFDKIHDAVITNLDQDLDRAVNELRQHLQARLDAIGQRGPAGWGEEAVSAAAADAHEQLQRANDLWRTLELR